jgi:hypothetical protein
MNEILDKILAACYLKKEGKKNVSKKKDIGGL